MNRYFGLASADLVVPNQEAWRLLADFQTLVRALYPRGIYKYSQSMQREIVDTLPGNTPLQNLALTTANAIMNAFQTGSHDAIVECRKLAERVFGENWEAKLPSHDAQMTKSDTPAIWGIGHCHIDTAWLWPYSVTQQKVARSWSTQVDLIERYPEFRFGASSAQQYKWLEQVRSFRYD
jgi:alpha-mannosidase